MPLPFIVLLGIYIFVVVGFVYTGVRALREHAVWIPGIGIGGRVMRGKNARVYGAILLTIGILLVVAPLLAYLWP